MGRLKQNGGWSHKPAFPTLLAGSLQLLPRKTISAHGLFPATITWDLHSPPGGRGYQRSLGVGLWAGKFIRAPTWVWLKLWGQGGGTFLLRRLRLQGELICRQEQRPPLRAAGQQPLFGQ